MPKFQKKTLNVIAQLKEVLKTTKYYPTLGHFYREIELLKFPYLKDIPLGRRLNPGHGRNVYSQQQYDNIVSYCKTQKWITVLPKNNRAYHVIVSNEIA
jgi:hypothetical protein